MFEFSVSFNSVNAFIREHTPFDLQVRAFLDLEAIVAEEEEDDYEEDDGGKSDAPVHLWRP